VSLAKRRRLRLLMLCAMYVAQGIPWGFTALTIPAYLASRGLDNAAVGAALAMTTLPYAFKWIWGPIIDAFTIPRFGRRRPWILFAQGMMALTILALALIPDLTADLTTLAWVVLIHTVFNALQDVAVDALAVDLLDEDERGRANGLMYASKYAGGMLGAGGLSRVIGWTSLTTALLLQVGVLLAIMMIPLFVRETDRPLEERPRLRTVLRNLVEVFAVRSALITALLMLTVNFALGILNANGFVLFTQQLGWSQEKYTDMTGFLGLAAGFGGSVVGGILADYVGRKKLAAFASVAMAGGWLAFGLLTSMWSNDAFVYPLAILETLSSSILTVTLFALCMDVSWARIGASQFAAYMALANFSTTVGFRFASTLTAHATYAQCYVVAAIIQVVVTAWIFAIDTKQTARELPRPDGAPLPARGLLAISGIGLILIVLTVYVVSPLF
jgi:PAT family beta-lactamase induction signal transducer AmpG